MKISKAEDDLQVTHTNFNYSILNTNFIKENQALMKIPNLAGQLENYYTIVYPKYAKGNWLLFLHADSRLDKRWSQRINGLFFNIFPNT